MKFTAKALKPWAPFIKYALGGIALYALIHAGILDPKKVASAMRHAPGAMLLALGLYLCVNICASARWWLLLKGARVRESGFRVLRLHMVGVFFSALLPGGTAGDLAKGFFLFRQGDTATSARAIASLVMDRLTGMSGLLTLVLAGGWLNYPQWRGNSALMALEISLGLAWIGMILVLWLSLHADNPRFQPLLGLLRRLPGGGFLSEATQALSIYRGQEKTLGLALLLSVGAHALLAGVYMACAWALDISLAWRDHLMAGPLCTVLNGMPLAPAGVGVGEAFGAWLYAALGAGMGGEILALVHVCVFLTAAFCSLAYFFERRG